MEGRTIIAIVGMCGAGKSEAGSILEKAGYTKVHFGAVTMEQVEKRGMEVSEANERLVREALRKQHGMAAYAILNIPKIEGALKTSNVLIDGLYSWSEYKILKEKFGDQLKVINIQASQKTRQQRLKIREHRPLQDYEVASRDYSEIENLEKGGPIAMADHTIVNEGTLEELYEAMRKIA
jgi:dephospho-CoA kinase